MTKILVHCIFPEQGREYTILTAKQSSQHRSSWSKTPDFLANCLFRVQSSCIANIEKPRKLIPAASVSVAQKMEYTRLCLSGKIEYGVKIVDDTYLLVPLLS